jgi:hypothetical protein
MVAATFHLEGVIQVGTAKKKKKFKNLKKPQTHIQVATPHI